MIGTMWWSRVLQLQKIHLKTLQQRGGFEMGFEENLDAIAPKIWNLEFIFNSKSKQLLISIHDHICEIGSLAYSCNCAQQDYLEFEIDYI